MILMTAQLVIDAIKVHDNTNRALELIGWCANYLQSGTAAEYIEEERIWEVSAEWYTKFHAIMRGLKLDCNIIQMLIKLRETPEWYNAMFCIEQIN